MAPKEEEPSISETEEEVECLIQVAIMDGAADQRDYPNTGFGNYPGDDDNVYCMMCPHQLDCIKVSKNES